MKSYILAYCLKNEFNGKATITDHFEVFCEYGEMEETPLELAEKRLQEIEQDFSENETFSLYTWNIAEIVQTSEHYETENEDQDNKAKNCYFSITGYWKDNKVEFENQIVSEAEAENSEQEDEEIFFYGLSEDQILKSIVSHDLGQDSKDDLEFVITSYSKL